MGQFVVLKTLNPSRRCFFVVGLKELVAQKELCSDGQVSAMSKSQLCGIGNAHSFIL